MLTRGEWWQYFIQHTFHTFATLGSKWEIPLCLRSCKTSKLDRGVAKNVYGSILHPASFLPRQKRAHTRKKRARTKSTRRMCLCTYIHCHLLSFCIKFYRDPTISCGDHFLWSCIILKRKKLDFLLPKSNPKVNKKFRFFRRTPSLICFYLFFVCYLSLEEHKNILAIW